MNEFKLTISTPDGDLFNGSAVQVAVRGTEGELSVLAGHIPFVTALRPADCRVYLPDGSVRPFRCEGGILSVSHAGVTILSSSAAFK